MAASTVADVRIPIFSIHTEFSKDSLPGLASPPTLSPQRGSTSRSGTASSRRGEGPLARVAVKRASVGKMRPGASKDVSLAMVGKRETPRGMESPNEGDEDHREGAFPFPQRDHGPARPKTSGMSLRERAYIRGTAGATVPLGPARGFTPLLSAPVLPMAQLGATHPQGGTSGGGNDQELSEEAREEKRRAALVKLRLRALHHGSSNARPRTSVSAQGRHAGLPPRADTPIDPFPASAPGGEQSTRSGSFRRSSIGAMSPVGRFPTPLGSVREDAEAHEPSEEHAQSQRATGPPRGHDLAPVAPAPALLLPPPLSLSQPTSERPPRAVSAPGSDAGGVAGAREDGAPRLSTGDLLTQNESLRRENERLRALAMSHAFHIRASSPSD
ncbi:hypothetical protein T484DRAFT_2023522, partial [Baffinella frigidus]